MASIMDSLGQFLTPETVGGIASTLGVDPKIAQQGMSMAGPLLLGAAGRKAATPEGAAALTESLGGLKPDQMLGALQKGDIGGMLSSLGGLGGTASSMMGAASDPGSAMVNQLLGAGGPAVANAIKGATGFDISPFLPMAAPMLAGLLSKAMKTGGLDAAGVSKLIKGENDAFGHANPALATQLEKALNAGDEVNALVAAKRAKYTDEQWTSMLKGPFAAGAAVMAASPSGMGGGAQEVSAMMDTLAEATKGAAPEALLSLLRGDFGARKDELQEALKADYAGAGDKVGAATSLCQRALEVVKAGGDQADIAEYRTMLLNVANAVAGAAKEGGFLGFGGKQVNQKEVAAIEGLRAALT